MARIRSTFAAHRTLIMSCVISLVLVSLPLVGQVGLTFSGGSNLTNCGANCIQQINTTAAQTFEIAGSATKNLVLSHNGTNGLIDTSTSAGNITVGGTNASGVTLGATSIPTTIAGNGTISGNLSVAGSAAFNAPVTNTAATYTVGATDNFLIANDTAGTQTLTLPSAASSTGRVIYVRTIAAQTVVSASSNVVTTTGGSAGTAILAGTAGKWAVLVSDGTAWQIMASN